MLPDYRYNAMIDVSPVTGALQQNRANAMADERLGMERERFGMQKQQFAADQNTKRMQRISGQLRVLSEMPDSPQKAALGERWWSANPDIAAHADTKGLNRADPNIWKFLAAEAGSYDPLKEAQLQHTKAAEGRAAAMHGPQLQAAQLDVASKQRELDNPAGKVTVLPDGSSAIITNTRTGQHEVIAAGGPKTPPGYRQVSGGLEAIPGGPADVKMNEKRQQDFASLQQMTQSLDALERSANEVLQHKGLAGNYGIKGVLPNIPGGNAADALALLETLRTKAGFATLQDMRNASKSGGALGAVSDKENQMLQNSIAALGKAQSYEQAQRQLKQLIAETQASKARIQAAYADHWNNHGAAARQNPTQPANTAPVQFNGFSARRLD